MQQRLAEASRPRCGMADGRAIAVEMDERQREAPVLRQVRLPDLQLLAARARAAAVLVQLAGGRLPALRRPRRDPFFDPTRVVAFPQLSLAGGAIKGWDRRNSYYFPHARKRSRKHYGFDVDTPFEELPERVQQRRAARLAATRRSRSRYRRRERGRPHGARARVRRHHPEPRAALPRDRFGRRCARSSRKYLQHAALPRVRRHAPAPRGAQRARSATATQARAIYEIAGTAAAATPGVLRSSWSCAGAKAEIADKIVKRDRAAG